MTFQNLNSIQKAYWNKFIFSLPVAERPVNSNISASFAGNKDITDGLLDLYLAGKKTAGSSIVEDFLTAGVNVVPTAAGTAFVGKTETMTTNGDGTASLVDATGATSTVALNFFLHNLSSARNTKPAEKRVFYLCILQPF